MKIHSLSKDDVFHTLVTSETGLSEDEAGRRLSEFGPNKITEVGRRSLLIRFLDQFTHFLAILLWIASAMSFLSEYLHPGEGMLTLGIAIVAVIFINAVFTFIQEYRAEKALEELQKLLPFFVRVLRDGREKEITAGEVVPGDVMILSEGDKVPADSRVIESSGLKVNNAPLTGEAEPLSRSSDPFQGEFMESSNIAFAGTTIVSGSGMAAVFATGMRTEFGRIALLTSAVEPGLSPLQKEIVKATRVVAAIAAGVGIFFFCLGFVIGRNFWDNFIFAIGITVALIPEGMLPTVTLSLAMGSQRMAKRKALIKTLTAVETLGSVSVICTDKTGTLTQNRMAVSRLWVYDRTINTGDLHKEDAPELLITALLCNNARFMEGQYKGDPTETAILKTAREMIGDIENERLAEIPFDPERKRMSTVNRTGGKVFAFSKGSVEGLLPLCSHLLKEGRKTLIDDAVRSKILDSCQSLMDRGLRVLAFAHRDMEDRPGPDLSTLEQDMIFLGLIGLEDPPRPEVPEAIGKCNEAGIKVIMITGDASRTAVAIGREIGLIQSDPVIVEGRRFGEMSDYELRKTLTHKEVIFSRMTPKHKMRVVSILKGEGEVVAVTGDGVNDAPALKKADIGISMGMSGTDVAKEASDMVLLDDNFATIVNAVEEGRTVYENIRKFITYIFASNIPEAVPYLSYILLRIPLPLTIMQILAVDLGTDMLPALALGAERPTQGIMKQPPRRPGERMLNFPLIARAYFFLGPFEAAACMFGFFWLLYQGGWHWGEILQANNILYMQATTACLTGIVITQVANVFACRSSRESVFSIGFFTNRLIFAGIAFELALQFFIVYHPWGNRIFATYPISSSIWLVLIPFAFVLFFAEEARKAVLRYAQPHHAAKSAL
ncbi:MAG: cation-transporting P-type ATPase [Nitrospirae bacterium]|nr:cation-transporting P-type ATPase [Nitrospirota bacterium]